MVPITVTEVLSGTWVISATQPLSLTLANSDGTPLVSGQVLYTLWFALFVGFAICGAAMYRLIRGQ